MILDFIYIVICVLIGYYFPNLFLKQNDARHKQRLKYLLCFHFLLGLAYYTFTTNGGGDAWGYWKAARAMSSEDFWLNFYEAKGTFFMYSVNYIPANVLQMSFLANTMLYTLIGYMGIVFFYLIAIKTIPYNGKFKNYQLFPLIFFMPNLHFWSSGVGKDTILFLCIAMFVYAMLDMLKRIPLLVVSILLSYLLRPHITLFLFVSFAFAFLFEAKVARSKRIALAIVLAVACIAILPSVMQFAKIEEATTAGFDQFSAKKAAALSTAGSGSAVNISSYPLPLKIFTFLYRPFFFDINGAPALAASLENFLLLLLSFKVLIHKPIETFKAAPFAIKGLVFFLLIGTLAFSQTLGNVGIMIRMRNMFLPGLLIFVLWSFSYRRQLELKYTAYLKKKKERLNQQIII